MKIDDRNSVSRRDAIRMSVASTGALWAAGGPGLARALAAASGAKVPIGVQLYSVRGDCEKDLPRTLHALGEMGFEGVEFAGYYGRTAAELRKLLDDSRLKCCGTHIGLDTLLGDALARTVEFNQTLGNKFLIVPSIPEERRKTAEDWRALARLFDELAGKVGPHGMRVGYHNHNFEFRPVPGSTSTPWDLFFGGTSKAVVMQVDVGNCIEGGGDPLAILKRYPGRAATIHVKEFSKSRPDAFIGEGDVPWKAVFEACEGPGGIEWYIVEYEHESQPALPAVGRCLKNLRAMGK
jgi:sugar phosphate isomerase/epimerase